MKKIRILLADDHTLLRAGIRALLEKQHDMEVVGEAADGREALQNVAELRPDVVLMDIAMPGMDGMEATKRIKSQYPDVQILALTMLEDDRYFFQMVRAGASGFLIKGALPDELLSALRTVAAGNVYLYPAMAKNLLHESASQTDTDGASLAADGLTKREQEVLRLISQERTGKEIAKLLQISVRTVDRHRENLMAKLNLHSRTALVKYAIRKGFVAGDT
ncbi:MAG: response regulator transcription factor [Thermoguttaceae bacterium]|jgi:two-component system response regulator NreC